MITLSNLTAKPGPGKEGIRVSHLIPLYKSERFYRIVVENVLALSDKTTEFILADSNGDTAVCDRYRKEFDGISNVRVICDFDNLSWVDNIARLIGLANGEYFQLLPQDDSALKSAIDAMLIALDAAPDAVLAYGRIRAFDLHNARLPERDELNLGEDPDSVDWTLDNVLPLFWSGRYGGAFKGLVRTAVAKRADNYLHSTPTTIHSERVWLFSMALAGRFVFVEQDALLKRYYPESTHRGWEQTPEVIQDAADLMVKAIRAKLTEPELRQYATQDVVANCALFKHAMINPDGVKFRYSPLADPLECRLASLGFINK